MKEETTSPTVSMDALMLLLLIDAFKERDVTTADVIGSYLIMADIMDEFTMLKLTRESVNIMCEVNLKYKDFVILENRKKELYLHLLKALYGCMQSALLWYKLFSRTLKGMGFPMMNVWQTRQSMESNVPSLH